MKRRTFALSSLGLLATVTLPAGASMLDRMAAMDLHGTRHFQNTSFGEIAYLDRGKGPVALFLHGFPLNGYQWRGQLERLSPWRRCLAPDFMGLGYTRVRSGQRFLPADQADMLAAFLDKLGVHAVDLVANDSGCAVAQLFLAKYPDRVRTLLLTNGDTEIDCPPPTLLPVIELGRQGRFAREWLAPWLADHASARSPEGLGGMTYTRPDLLSDAAIDMYLTPLVANQDLTNAFALSLEANSLVGLEASLRQKRQPVRIVWGQADTIFNPGAPAYLDKLFSNSKGVRTVPEGKLFFPEEFPDLIAEEAKRLWEIA